MRHCSRGVARMNTSTTFTCYTVKTHAPIDGNKLVSAPTVSRNANDCASEEKRGEACDGVTTI